MPNIVRCTQDIHHYDSLVHSTCPFCRATRPVTQPAEPASVPTQPSTGHMPTQVIWPKSAVGPAVGWLVIIDGPSSDSGNDTVSNRGRDYRLVPNRNRIGRSRNCEVTLDYGDNEISGEHCALVYDTLNNMFYLQPSEGRNLTYVAEVVDGEESVRWAPVLNTRELKARDQIRIGKTVLVFVPFCGVGVW